MKTNSIKSIRILYSVFGGILLICVALFFCNVFTYAEQFELLEPNCEFRSIIMDANDSTYVAFQPVNSPDPDIKAHAHIRHFDVDFYQTDGQYVSDPRNVWALVLQIASILSFGAIVVLVAIELVSLYRNAKRGRIFPPRSTSMLTAIGVLLIVASLCLDTGNFIQHLLAFDMLKGSDWQPSVSFTINFTRIFFGLTLIFLAQIFRIGRDLQEEQELTI